MFDLSSVKVGDIVTYVLSDADVLMIPHNDGNSHYPGQELPLIVTRVWENECGMGRTGVNGQVVLDVNIVLWVTSRCEGVGPSTYRR